MAFLQEQNMLEMEAEMSRFEHEILAEGQDYGPHNSSRFILGAQTFSAVQNQIGGDGPYDNFNIIGPARPAHPPPLSAQPTASPPSFVPHQLRQRAPHPAGSRPPFMGPPGPRHPGGPPVRGHSPWHPPNANHGMRPPALRGAGGPPPSHGHRQPPPLMPGSIQRGPVLHESSQPDFEERSAPSVSASATIDGPKVVYSSAPVIIKPPKLNKDDDKPKEPVAKVRKLNQSPAEPINVEQVYSVYRGPPTMGPRFPQPPPFRPPSQKQLASAPGPANVSFVTDPFLSSKHLKKEKKKKDKKFLRMAAGSAWEDTSLHDWDPEDFRIFCGDLGNEVTDDGLARAFSRYPSFQKAKVIRDKRTQKTKGYGFVSFKDPDDFTRAIREVNGRYVGNRPIKLRKSNWKDRNIDNVKKKEKEKKKLGLK